MVMYFGQRGEREFYSESEIGRSDESSEVEVTEVKRQRLQADIPGRILLDSATVDREMMVVLYELPGGTYQPYVTWMARRDAPENTFWGHYFVNLEDAQEDFEKRLGHSWDFR